MDVVDIRGNKIHFYEHQLSDFEFILNLTTPEECLHIPIEMGDVNQVENRIRLYDFLGSKKLIYPLIVKHLQENPDIPLSIPDLDEYISLFKYHVVPVEKGYLNFIENIFEANLHYMEDYLSDSVEMIQFFCNLHKYRFTIKYNQNLLRKTLEKGHLSVDDHVLSLSAMPFLLAISKKFNEKIYEFATSVRFTFSDIEKILLKCIKYDNYETFKKLTEDYNFVLSDKIVEKILSTRKHKFFKVVPNIENRLISCAADISVIKYILENEDVDCFNDNFICVLYCKR